jgi:hypothetical protein
MKKQFLVLALVLVAFMASVTISLGQAVKWSDPRPFTCEDDALHPIAGKLYTYEAEGLPSGGTWRFWATQDPNFITDNAGTPVFNSGTALEVTDGELLFASPDYNIDVLDIAANTDGSIQLRWSSTILAATEYRVTPTFVVAYYVDANGCTDNIKVWELDPMNGFIVDVIAIDIADPAASQDAYDTTPEQCVDNIESAIYQAGAMVYDYGDNYLYFEFIAANFTNYWVPTFELTGIDGSQAITSYEFTYDTPDTWDASTVWEELLSGDTEIEPAASVTDITLGVSIFVRVLIDHNQFEHLADVTYTMTLDGQNADGLWDVRNEDCAEPDPNEADGADTATSVITLRPTVSEVTTSPIAPNEEFIPGNED